jgi:hypothetical protein
MLGVFVFGMIFISMFGIVSAQSPVESVQNVANDVYELAKPVLDVAVGKTATTDLFLAKILFLIIIFAIVWKALEQVDFFSDTPWILWVISIAVSLVAIRWFGSSDIVKTILLPYSAFGVALTAGIPFVLYFLIVKNFQKTWRKIAWIFFAVVFVGLWIMRSGIRETPASTQVGAFSFIYLITAGLAVLVWLFDGTIQKIMHKAELERGRAYSNKKFIEDLQLRIVKLDELYYDHGQITEKQYNARLKDLQKRIHKLTK